jgi:PBSX family phage terminase large subunit
MKINLTYKQTEFYDAVFDNNGEVNKQSVFEEFYFFGGFGSAKSRIVSFITNKICLQYPGCHGVYIRGTFPELKDSVIPQYLDNYPPGENGYTFNISDRTANYDNGTRLDFRAFDKDAKILSNEYDFIVYCQLEEVPQELFLASLGRNRRRKGGLPKNIILAEGNPASGWVKERLKDNPLKPNMFLVEAKTSDNPYLPAGYEANMRANYPDFWIARYLDGEWTSVDEAVYSEFREKTHVINPIDFKYISGFVQRGGFDYGYRTNSAINWSYVDYDGNIVIFDEWYAKGQEQNQIREVSKRYEDKKKTLFVADFAIKRPDRDGRNLWDELQNMGMLLTEASKDEMNSILLVNSMFKQGKLKITRNCTNTIKEVMNWKWKQVKFGSQKEIPDEPVDKDNHHCDNINYIVSNICGQVTMNPDIKKYEQSLEFATKYQKKFNKEYKAFS